MVPEVNADDRRHRDDEAVRRLREESRRRIERRRPGMSHCMLGTMLAMLLFVALNARRIYWANARSEESAHRPAPALSADVAMPRAEDVRVEGFVPLPQRAGRRPDRHCKVEYEPLTGERLVTCSYSSSRASRPACAGSHNRR